MFIGLAIHNLQNSGGTLQVQKLFDDVGYVPPKGQEQQANWDAWDLRRLWTFLWRRSQDALKRGQHPRDRSLDGSV